MKKLTFKLIPFLISLLMVIGSVTGISLYSIYKYDNYKLRFVADYFSFGNYSTKTTEELIENFIRFESHYFHLVDEEINYYDCKSNEHITSKPTSLSSTSIKGATYENGVLHLPNLFDVRFYFQISYDGNAEKYITSYYGYIYNVNYNTLGVNIIDHLYIAFVDGIGTSTGDNTYGTTKLELVLDEVKSGKNGSPSLTQEPSYEYTNKNKDLVGNPNYIYDVNAKGTTDIPRVYRLVLSKESVVNNDPNTTGGDNLKSFDQFETSTFSIFYSGDESIADALGAGRTELKGYKELVRGTFENPYKNVEEIIEASKDSENQIYKGYELDVYKAPFVKYLTKTLVISGLITFAISFFIATLFYLIWQDDESNDNKVKLNKKRG